MATPTYSDLTAMVASSGFIDRCTFAVAYYARYILGEDPKTQNHQRRFNWAAGAILSPQSVANSLKYVIAQDSAYTSQDPLSFAQTPDNVVQATVEAAINQTVLQF